MSKYLTFTLTEEQARWFIDAMKHQVEESNNWIDREFIAFDSEAYAKIRDRNYSKKEAMWRLENQLKRTLNGDTSWLEEN